MGCLRSHRRNLKIVPSHRTTALWTYVIEGVEPASLGLNVSIRYGDTGARSEAHWPDPISALRHHRGPISVSLLAGRWCRSALTLTSSGCDGEPRPITVPDTTHDCGHEDHAAREVGDDRHLSEADRHQMRRQAAFSRVLISAFSVAETI